MVFIYTAITAILLSLGQALWKIAALKFPLHQKDGLSSFEATTKVLLSYHFILGAIIYVLATLLYLWLFSKYPFFIVQITLVSFAIVFSLTIATLLFRENISLINLIGIPLIILGALLATWKK
jgi:drug/metabolite transporter (DMT)-like permease